MVDVVGFRTRDPVTGNIIVDITDRLTRVIGVVYSGNGAGSIQVPDFALGLGWAATLEAQPPNNNLPSVWAYPQLTISGTTLSWAFTAASGATPVPSNIMYGVY